jgi:hypothetical protein
MMRDLSRQSRPAFVIGQNKAAENALIGNGQPVSSIKPRCLQRNAGPAALVDRDRISGQYVSSAILQVFGIMYQMGVRFGRTLLYLYETSG